MTVSNSKNQPMNKKIDLQTIFDETERRFPWIYQIDDFDILYHGWRQQGIRHGRNAQFYVLAYKRGWLSKKDADDFRKYIGLR